jgi:hypothetical protein
MLQETKIIASAQLSMLFHWQSLPNFAYPFFFSFWVLHSVGFDFVVNITEILLN